MTNIKNKKTAWNRIAGIVCYNDGVLYYFNVCLEIYISGNDNTDNSGSGRVDISGCQNCDMPVPAEQLVHR